jgi:NADH:ubiquinone oxidoreductase subunit 5 (subunit L)/multisubunit Na+/H+ antiporter MnhA subunit
LDTAYFNSRERYYQLKETLNRNIELHISGRAYIVWLLVAVALELPINRLARVYVLTQHQLVAAFTALALGALLLAMAHAVGLWLRFATGGLEEARTRGTAEQVPMPIWVPPLIRVLVSVLFLGIAGCVIYALGKLRQAYANIGSVDAGSRIGDVLTEEGGGTESAIADAANQAMQIPLGIEGWILIALNAIIFLIGIVLSFYHHDRHKEFHRSYKDMMKFGPKFQKAYDRYKKKREEIEQKVSLIDHKKTIVAQRRQDADDLATNGIERVTNITQTRLTAYQQANLAARTDRERPASFVSERSDIKELLKERIGNASPPISEAGTAVKDAEPHEQ